MILAVANQKGRSFIMAEPETLLMGCFREFGTLPQSAYIIYNVSVCVCVCVTYTTAVVVFNQERTLSSPPPNMLFSI